MCYCTIFLGVSLPAAVDGVKSKIVTLLETKTVV